MRLIVTVTAASLIITSLACSSSKSTTTAEASAPQALTAAGPTSAEPRPRLDIWNEPTDVPVQKTDEYGVVDPEFARMHNQFVQRAAEGNVGVLFLGDSITNGWFWGDNREIWDQHFGAMNPANFGIGGDRTEHVLWRIQNGELEGIQPKVVVLLIGTNNIGYSAEDITKGVLAIVDTLHRRLPESKLLITAIFPRGQDPADPGTAAMREKIRTVNAVLAKLDDGERTRYLDISDQLLSPDGTLSADIMPDFLHLSYDGYRIWANALDPLLAEMMQ